jgi:outer membrane protein assembly factor BamE (lipoprotein component of BamABCDE complex)
MKPLPHLRRFQWDFVDPTRNPTGLPMNFRTPITAAILACLPLLATASQAEGDRLQQIHAGMTREEVQAVAGPPRITTGADRAGRTVWTYEFTDVWGYESDFEVAFDSDGRVADTFAERHPD